MNEVYIYPVIIVFSFLFTELIRRYTLNNNFLDTPNERSSHTIPTPRGGGIAFVIIFLLSLFFIKSLPTGIIWALLGSGILAAGIGFWDDYGQLSAKWRLLSHFIAAFWALYWLGGVSALQIFGFDSITSWIGFGLIIFLLVWLLNLFNFMDGIDGIAASEAVFVACAGAYFAWMLDLEYLTFILLSLAAATFGFLLLNWSPAKIFMGDVGSGFLGLILGVIAYESILKGVSVWIWGILLAVFLVDSGVTLTRRFFNGEKWYEAHCSHAYQNAAKKWGHKKVTISVILINLFYLFPLSHIAYSEPNYAIYMFLLAYMPLVFIALKFKAGKEVTPAT